MVPVCIKMKRDEQSFRGSAVVCVFVMCVLLHEAKLMDCPWLSLSEKRLSVSKTPSLGLPLHFSFLNYIQIRAQLLAHTVALCRREAM